MKLSVSELSKIDFGSSHRWSVMLEGIGLAAGSGEYIPATSVEETFTGIETKSVEAGPTSYDIPYTISSIAVSITFIDDIAYTIHDQLVNWYKEVFDKGRVHFSKRKKLKVIKYGIKDEILSSNTYEVLPGQDIKFVGSSDPQLLTNTISFIVINQIN
nr:MAG TPA: hypothetical protein [Bacteriophage sp.]